MSEKKKNEPIANHLYEHTASEVADYLYRVPSFSPISHVQPFTETNFKVFCYCFGGFFFFFIASCR